jgi:acetolactate synthase regulatory subunit
MLDTDQPTKVAALVLMRDRPEGLLRLLGVMQRRGWAPTAMTFTTYGELAEAAVCLTAPTTRSTAMDLAAQVRRLIDVVDVVCDTDPGVPDDIALAGLRGRAPWHCSASPAPVSVAA